MAANEKPGIWKFTIILPRDVRRALVRFMADNEVEEFQEIGEEMLTDWAKKHGIKLPNSASPRHNQPGNNVLVSNVG